MKRGQGTFQKKNENNGSDFAERETAVFGVFFFESISELLGANSDRVGVETVFSSEFDERTLPHSLDYASSLGLRLAR